MKYRNSKPNTEKSPRQVVQEQLHNYCSVILKTSTDTEQQREALEIKAILEQRMAKLEG